MTWNAGDDNGRDCYECGKELGRNRVSEKLPFLNKQNRWELEPVCEDCYVKLTEGPRE